MEATTIGTSTDTHCPYCALQCAMRLEARPARTPTVSGRDFPTNRGGLCRKGWTSASVLAAPDRLTTPLVRTRDGVLAPAGWDEALGLVTERVHALQDRHGPGAVAVFGGGGLTNEKAYLLGKLARVALRTPCIDYNGRFCMSAAATAANRSLGVDRGLPFPLPDLADADAVLLVGSNPAETMPPLVQHLAGVLGRGGLLVVDPRHSATAALTDDGGGLHLQPVPGTDLPLLLGLLHVVLHEGLADEHYLRRRTTGVDDLRRSVALWWPGRAASVCGIPEAQLRRAAHLLAAGATHRGGAGAYVLTGRGAEQHVDGTDTVTTAINLALALGLPGSTGGGYGALTGQGNGQGGREHGQKCDQLPGYRLISDPAAREHVAAVWGVDPATIPGPGVPAVELIRRLGTEDGPRALLVHGSNLLVSAPNGRAVARRLAALDLLVVADVVPSETARAADVVLPVTQWAEEEGTMTNLDGRVLRRRLAVSPPAQVRDELAVIAELGRRLGARHGLPPAAFPDDAATVFDELARASAGGRADYSGLSHRRLDESGPLHWPCPVGSDGTPRLFGDGFPTADGRARLVAVRAAPREEVPGAEAPIWLITGRVMEHYQSGAQTRRVPELLAAAPEAGCQMHPQLAQRLGVEDRDLVRVESTRGAIELPARLSGSIRADTVFVPFHFGGAALVNAVTTDACDPVSGMPQFKACAVRVSAVPVDLLAAAAR